MRAAEPVGNYVKMAFAAMGKVKNQRMYNGQSAAKCLSRESMQFND
jgi:hypothetical protein